MVKNKIKRVFKRILTLLIFGKCEIKPCILGSNIFLKFTEIELNAPYI
jgi:hypothetical protein